MAWGFNHPNVSSPPPSDDEEVLLALHGMGGSSWVWTSVLRFRTERWPAWWSTVDLPGHGSRCDGSPEDYTFDAMARTVAAHLPPARSYVVVGHSLGGVVALRLAALEPRVRRVVGVGIKVEWSDDELARAAELAARPAPSFDTEAEALARFRKVSGVGALLDDEFARHGVVEGPDEQWRLRFDPRVLAVGRPDMAALVAGCPAEIVMARGEHDPMCTEPQLAALVPDSVTLPGVGHQAHLEAPDAVCALLEPRV